MINWILVAIVVAAATLGLAGWLSDDWPKWAAARLLARREALKAYRLAFEDGVKHWEGKIG